MGWAVVFLALLTYCTGINGQSTWTQPPSSSVSLGESVTISCKTTQSSYCIGWYQQKPGEAPRYVQCSGYSRGEGIPDRFTATKSGSTGSLAITNVQAEDEAIYYCGSWNSAVTQFLFGGGTQLTVTGQPTVSPTLNVYIPSEKEITNPRTPVLVCLISNFYPPGFTLKWKGDNNQEIASGVETTKASKQGDKYVASSYLTMSPSDYESHDSYTCEVRHGENTHVKTVLRSGSC
ncbi:immunoglobulin lambda-1 light chain-like [Protobothrops mucrosquamatus]|uniref:immunoglobulin lambda-1 light chain-like n=1 Tax=Protobothrops mucrosquamatus TaxID=103944 RepID=UPI0010FB009E|nr:immunoglobulin lambda-1 light chain-like [Protobothrops mucrosquamatus]